MTTRRMRIARWIPKPTDTHSGCVTHIDFLLKQLLHESTSLLRYPYIVCLRFLPQVDILGSQMIIGVRI